MEVSGQLLALAPLPPGARAPGTHWIGGWIGPRAGLNMMMRSKNPSSCWESKPGPISNASFIAYKAVAEEKFCEGFG